MTNGSFFPANRIKSSNLTRTSSANRAVLSTIQLGDKLMVSFVIMFAILTVILNGLILAAFIRNSNLRTSFNTYVISLAVIDIIIALSVLPRILLKQFYGHWPYDGLSCSILLSIGQIVSSANRAAHLLIAANRLWAVTFPLSYRNRHKKGLTLKIVSLSWALVVCIATPEVVIGRWSFINSFNRKDPACVFDTDHYWAYHMTFNVVVYDLPEVIILVAYPVLMFKLRKMTGNRIEDEGLETGKCHGPELPNSPWLRDRAAERLRHSDEMPESKDSVAKDERTGSGAQQPQLSHRTESKTVGQSEAKHQQRQSTRAKGYNRLFTYLVVAVICCWTPNHVFFLLSGITDYWNVPFFTVQFFLGYGNSWLNPMLIYMADVQIRKTVDDFVKCGHNKRTTT